MKCVWWGGRDKTLTESGDWNSLIAKSIYLYKYAPPFEKMCKNIGFVSKLISYSSLTIFCPIGCRASRFQIMLSTGAIYRTVINLRTKRNVLNLIIRSWQWDGFSVKKKMMKKKAKNEPNNHAKWVQSANIRYCKANKLFSRSTLCLMMFLFVC